MQPACWWARTATIAALLAALGCSRDLSIPLPPGPGTIQGRVVYAVPGQVLPVAGKGAVVTILSTSLGATADADGRFLIEGITGAAGQMLIQLDLDGDGKPDLQSLIQLASIRAGPGRDLSLGDVPLAQNALVRGKVTRADVNTVGGHSGTSVFVPQGPFLTQTADDGSYLLPELPPGTIALTFFHDGYDPQGLDGITLGAGQDFTARDVNLVPAKVAPQPGKIIGTVTVTPSVDASAAAVTAFPPAGAALTTHPTAAGAFTLASVPPGLYRVEVSLSSYSTAVVANVLVRPAGETQLAVALVTNGVTVTPPPPPPPTTCVAGVRCTLPDPCKIGQVNCATGSPACVVAGSALDG